MQNLNILFNTSRLILRPFQDADLNDIFEYHSSPEVVRYMYWKVRDPEQTRAALEQKKGWTSLHVEGDALCLAVELKEKHKVIGEVILFWRSQIHQQGEVGYVFHPGYSGKGYATEAAKVMLALGFEQMAFHRIYARCDPRNVPSWRLMERLGCDVRPTLYTTRSLRVSGATNFIMRCCEMNGYKLIEMTLKHCTISKGWVLRQIVQC